MWLLSTFHQELSCSCWSAAPIIEKGCYVPIALHTTSFMALKERLATAPILVYLDFAIPFTLYTDASGFNLSQIQHGQERNKNFLWWSKLFRHWEKIFRYRTTSVISNSCYSKALAILAGQSLHCSRGPPSSQMASVTAWYNWPTSPVGLDITRIWLQHSIPPWKRPQ